MSGGTFLNYIGNYDYYLEKRDLVNALWKQQAGQAQAASGTDAASDGRAGWKAQKEEQARLRRRQNALKKAEEEISRLEEEDAQLTEQLQNPAIATDAARLMELHRQQEQIQKQLAGLYEDWERLAEEAQEGQP